LRLYIFGWSEGKAFPSIFILKTAAREIMSALLQAIVYITYLGTASFVMDAGDTRIITDPGDFFTSRLDAKKIAAIEGIDLVMVTHADFDHTNRLLDIKGIDLLPVVGTKSVKASFPKLNIITEESYDIDGVSIKRIGSIHGVRHDVDHSSYLIETGGIAILFLGDAYRLINPLKEHVDLMFVTIGGFEASPENAMKLVSEIEPDIVIPMHWEVLFRTDEPAQRFAKLIEKSGMNTRCVIPAFDKKMTILKDKTGALSISQ
jgi:L-ascorbate metabolism protein UlaG (beta-lactamase superfamily)